MHLPVEAYSSKLYKLKEDELRLQAAEDYFRTYIYPLETDAALEVLEVLKSPR